MINHFFLREEPFELESEFVNKLTETEWEDEVGQSLPNTGGDSFSVLSTGASGPFHGWVWPVPVWNGRKPVIPNGFDPRVDSKWGMKHAGVDLYYIRRQNEPAIQPEGYKHWFVPSNRIPVYAVGDGIVVSSGPNSYRGSSLGHFVIIDHQNGYRTFYQHLTARGLPAKSTRVSAGMPIGIVGHGDETRINHLHFELWKGGNKKGAIDPEPVLRGLTGRTGKPAPVPLKPVAVPGPAAEALRRGQWAEAIRITIQQGERDESRLTSMVFFARYPKREGRKLMRGEPGFDALAKEWLTIRDSLVKPALSRLSAPGRSIPIQELESFEVGSMPSRSYGTLVVEKPSLYRFNYNFTSDDALWLARLVKGEAGGRDDLNNHAVIWAMFNRFALFTHAGSYWMKKAGRQGYPTFSTFIQSYSTTLQPVLYSVEAAQRAIALSQKDPLRFQYIKTGGFYKNTTIPKGQLKHHLDRIQKMTWSSLSQETRSMIERALKGALPNPIGQASEFANTKTYFIQNKKRSPQNYDEWRSYTEFFARRKKWTWIGPVSGLAQMTFNAFFLDNRVRNLPKGTVRVKPPT